MKNRSRPFDCAIAGKVVGISLRHGGGLQEPDSIYVRCDERDCQYVDLNTPPCPLRIDMFADGSERVVASHLEQHAGQRFCYACLTELLDITHEQVRRASWRVKGRPGVSIRPSRCSVCHHRRVTIAVARGSAAPREAEPESVPRDVVVEPLEAYLRRHSGYSFCAHCLARELGVPAAAMRENMWALEPRDEFDLRTSQCVSCLLMKPVIQHREAGMSEVDNPRRAIEVLLKAEGAPLCVSCIAFSAELPLAEARRILKGLATLPEFTSAETACGTCGRWQPAMRLAFDTTADAERLEAIGAMLSGQAHHRGLRIDLLSFRARDGWRPFALVRSAAGVLVADVPPIVLDVLPTKLEADELAAIRAREWIDERLP